AAVPWLGMPAPWCCQLGAGSMRCRQPRSSRIVMASRARSAGSVPGLTRRKRVMAAAASRISLSRSGIAVTCLHGSLREAGDDSAADPARAGLVHLPGADGLPQLLERGPGFLVVAEPLH